MSHQVIPAEAVEAAEEAVRQAMIEHGPDGHTDGSDKIARAALEAAAPYMLAQAWEEGRRADDFEVSIGLDRNPYMLNNEGEK